MVRALARGDHVQLGSRDENGWAPLYAADRVDGYVYRASELVQADPPAASREVAPRQRELGYHLGPRGGCYTYTASGNKRYVDRELCD